MWWAVLLAGAASAVRPVGFAVGVAVLVLAAEQYGLLVGVGSARWARRLHVPAQLQWRRLRWRHVAMSLVSIWGVVAYSAYLAARWGSPLLWIGVQTSWSQGPMAGPQSWFKVHMVARMIRIHDATTLLVEPRAAWRSWRRSFRRSPP